MDKKKITIVYIIDELNIGGTEIQLLKAIEHLDKNKFNPILICLRPSRYYFQADIKCKKYILNVTSLISFCGLLKFFFLVYYLKKHKVDIVQSFFIDSSIFGIPAAKLAGVKKIISCRRDMGFWYSPKIIKIFRCTNIFIDKFLVNSFAIKENIAKYESIPPNKIDVIYNGIDLEPFKKLYDTKLIKKNLKINEHDYIIGMIANLNRPVKRVDVFIKAAAELLKKLKDISFVIVGEGYLKQDLQNLAEDLDIQNKIYFLGLQKDIHPYLSLFDIGVITSDSEGFSNSILEYMAANIPVVCTNSGGNSELIANGTNGYLVEIANFFEIANKIFDILNNKTLKTKMSLENRRKIKSLAWPNIIKQIEKYYTFILS